MYSWSQGQLTFLREEKAGPNDSHTTSCDDIHWGSLLQTLGREYRWSARTMQA